MERQIRGLVRGFGLGLIIAWLGAVEAPGAESAADAIKAFGLIGTWSVDCTRDVRAACDRTTGCGARVTYLVSPSGQPMISNIVGTRVAGQPRTVETTIEQATRIADDKLAITSIQRTDSGVTVMWWRQPGEVWEIVLLKVGDKFRTFSAHREDGKKVSAEAGFEVRPPPPPPPSKMYDTLPTIWGRTAQETPLFERCSD
jgi:hypothetical protein